MQIFMRFFLFIAICVFVGVDILLAQEMWGIMKSKRMIREEFMSAPSTAKTLSR